MGMVLKVVPFSLLLKSASALTEVDDFHPDDRAMNSRTTKTSSNRHVPIEKHFLQMNKLLLMIGKAAAAVLLGIVLLGVRNDVEAGSVNERRPTEESVRRRSSSSSKSRRRIGRYEYDDSDLKIKECNGCVMNDHVVGEERESSCLPNCLERRIEDAREKLEKKLKCDGCFTDAVVDDFGKSTVESWCSDDCVDFKKKFLQKRSSVTADDTSEDERSSVTADDTSEDEDHNNQEGTDYFSDILNVPTLRPDDSLERAPSAQEQESRPIRRRSLTRQEKAHRVQEIRDDARSRGLDYKEIEDAMQALEDARFLTVSAERDSTHPPNAAKETRNVSPWSSRSRSRRDEEQDDRLNDRRRPSTRRSSSAERAATTELETLRRRRIKQQAAELKAQLGFQ